MVFFLFSCEKEENVEELFSNYGRVKFCFLNREGKDLINIEKIETYPVSFIGDFKKLDKNEVNKTFDILYRDSVYQYRGNEIKFDKINKHYYWKGYMHAGDNKDKGYNNYVHIGDDIDTITIKITPSNEPCYGGVYVNNPCVYVSEIYYNGTKVYSDGRLSKKLKPKYVDIIKTNGNTEVKLVE